MISVWSDFDTTSFEFAPDFALTLNLPTRRNLILTRVRACLKRYGPTHHSIDNYVLRASFDRTKRLDLRSLKREVEQIINEISDEPLAPKMACRLLNMSSSELRKLTDDGQIQYSGQSEFNSSGHKGYFNTFSAESIRNYLTDRDKGRQGVFPERPGEAIE